MGDHGSLNFNLVGTATDLLNNGTGSLNCAGLFGTTCGTPTPKWRHKARLTWVTPWNVSLSGQWRYTRRSSLDFEEKSGAPGSTVPCNPLRRRLDATDLAHPLLQLLRPVWRMAHPRPHHHARRRQQRVRQGPADPRPPIELWASPRRPSATATPILRCMTPWGARSLSGSLPTSKTRVPSSPTSEAAARKGRRLFVCVCGASVSSTKGDTSSIGDGASWPRCQYFHQFRSQPSRTSYETEHNAQRPAQGDHRH